MEARFDDDLSSRCSPTSGAGTGVGATRGGRRPTVWPVLMWLMPVVLAMVITAVLVGAPWILWGFFGCSFSRAWRRRRYHPVLQSEPAEVNAAVVRGPRDAVRVSGPTSVHSRSAVDRGKGRKIG
jgi:hypothetical protein